MDTCYFCAPRGPQKCLLGRLPKPANFGTKCPKVDCLRPVANAPVPYVRAPRWRGRGGRGCPWRRSAPAYPAGPPGTRHRGPSAFRPAPAAAFSARPSSAALPRPKARSWRPCVGYFLWILSHRYVFQRSTKPGSKIIFALQIF